MPKLGFDIADLQGGMKRLNESDGPAEAKGPAAPDPEVVAQEEAMEALYLKHDGDLVAIFQELDANPEKALKPHNKPKSAREFARKYVAGSYTLLKDEAAPAEAKDGRK